MNPVIQKHFDALQRRFAGAAAMPRSDGSVLIQIPNFPLPSGWTSQETTLRFLVPVQYPIAQPDCFWADTDLRLTPGNRTPQNTNISPIPPPPGDAAGPGLLWFSWHVQGWDANRGTLVGYVQTIKSRLDQRQ